MMESAEVIEQKIRVAEVSRFLCYFETESRIRKIWDKPALTTDELKACATELLVKLDGLIR